MRQLLIDGVRVDLDEQTIIAVTYRGGNLRDPLSQQVNSTNSFTLPRTPTNDKMFKFAAEPSSAGGWQREEHVAQYYQSGAQLIRGGRATLHGIEDNRYRVTVAEGESLVKELKTALFRDTLDAQFKATAATRVLRASAGDCYSIDASSFGFVRPLWTYGHDPTNNKYITAPLALPVTRIAELIEAEHSCTISLPAGVDDLVMPYWAAIVFYNNTLSGNQYKLVHVDELTTADHAEVKDWQEDNGFRFTYIPNPQQYYGDSTVMQFLKSLAAITCSNIEIKGDNISIVRLDTVAAREARDWTGSIIGTAKIKRKLSAWDFARDTYILNKTEEGADKQTGGILVHSNSLNLDAQKTLKTGAVAGTRYLATMGSGAEYTLTSVGGRSKKVLDPPISWTDLQYQFSHYSDGRESRNSVHTKAPTSGLPFLQMQRDKWGNLDIETGWNVLILGTNSDGWLRAIDGGSAALYVADYVDMYAYYTALEHSVDEPLSYELTKLFSPLDIQRLDFGYPVKFKELGGVFYLDEVTSYNAEAKRAGTAIKITKLKA